MTFFRPLINQSVCVMCLSHIISRDYFMVGECVRFLFTSCEGSVKRTSERSERVSLAILHNE